jgi:hypothetical protein
MAGSLCLALAVTLAAQNNSSLSDLNIEFTEAKVTLQSVTEENARLQEQLAITHQQVKSLTESLAIANSEAEVFKRETGELKLRMEALGIDAAGSGKNKLEQRLLKAVSDLKIVQDDKDKLADQLVRLSEAVVRFLKTATSTDPDARMGLEAEMRAVNEALGIPTGQAVEMEQAAPTLTGAMVISVKEEFALVVANVGSKQGVKIGMPFKVMRKGSQIGLVRVVDVREKISGAVIQEIDSAKNKVKVGDRLEVDARQ